MQPSLHYSHFHVVFMGELIELSALQLKLCLIYIRQVDLAPLLFASCIVLPDVPKEKVSSQPSDVNHQFYMTSSLITKSPPLFPFFPPFIQVIVPYSRFD